MGGFIGGTDPSYAGGFIQAVLSGINHTNSHITLRMEDLRRRFIPERKDSAEENEGRVAARLNPSNLTASNDDNFIALNPQTQEKQEQLRREVAEKEKERPWNFYFGPTGRASGEVHARKDQPGLDYWSAGALAGFDYAFSQVGVGLMVDYDRIEAHGKHQWGTVITDEFQASVYSTYAPACLPELALNGIVGGAYELYFIKRNTGTPSDHRIAKGTPHGESFDALLGVEYALASRQLTGIPKHLQVIPLANVQYAYLRAEHYEEHGAGAFDMEVRGQHIKSLRSSLGFRVNYAWEMTNFTFTPEIYGEWQREYLNNDRHLRFTPVEFTTPTAH